MRKKSAARNKAGGSGGLRRKKKELTDGKPGRRRAGQEGKMKRYLSVDCGGTKTAFLLCGETGRAEASCTLGPANYMVIGKEAVFSVLREGDRGGLPAGGDPGG